MDIENRIKRNKIISLLIYNICIKKLKNKIKK